MLDTIDLSCIGIVPPGCTLKALGWILSSHVFFCWNIVWLSRNDFVEGTIVRICTLLSYGGVSTEHEKDENLAVCVEEDPLELHFLYMQFVIIEYIVTTN